MSQRMSSPQLAILAKLVMLAMLLCIASPMLFPSPLFAADEKDTRPTINVADVKALLEAIGSDRIIELQPGEYNLTKHQGLDAKGIEWDEAHDGRQLIFNGLKNLTLRGLGDERVRIVAEPRFVDVLLLEGCENLVFENLFLGHTDIGPCSAGVIRANRCKKLTFRDCELYGCGSEGLTLKRIDGLLFVKSQIHHCSNGVMTVSHSRDLRFVESHFHNNSEFWGLVFRHCPSVVFEKCLVEHNKVRPSDWSPSTLFHVEVSTVSFDGLLRNNDTPGGDVNASAKVVVDPKTDAFTITHTAEDARRDEMEKEKRVRRQRIESIIEQIDQLEKELQQLLEREQRELNN